MARPLSQTAPDATQGASQGRIKAPPRRGGPCGRRFRHKQDFTPIRPTGPAAATANRRPGKAAFRPTLQAEPAR